MSFTVTTSGKPPLAITINGKSVANGDKIAAGDWSVKGPAKLSISGKNAPKYDSDGATGFSAVEGESYGFASLEADGYLSVKAVKPEGGPIVVQPGQSQSLGLLGLVLPGMNLTAQDWIEVHRCHCVRVWDDAQQWWAGDKGTQLHQPNIATLKAIRTKAPKTKIILSVLVGWSLDLDLLGPRATRLGKVRTWAKQLATNLKGLVDYIDGPNEPGSYEFNAQVKRGVADWMEQLAEVYAVVVDELKVLGVPIAGPGFVRPQDAAKFHRLCPGLTAIAAHPYMARTASAVAAEIALFQAIAPNLPVVCGEFGPADTTDYASEVGRYIDAILPHIAAGCYYTLRCSSADVEKKCPNMPLYTFAGQPRQALIDAWAARLPK